MRMIDLRSDTITEPTTAMRKAMYNAEIGDDVFGEDPTVNRLEEMSAKLTGKEAALFVASGTMANLVSELAHCGRGDEMILGDQSHIFYYEQGGCAALGGIHPRTVPNQADGKIRIEDLDHAIRAENVHFPVSRLIVLENTHNRCNGSPLSSSYMKEVGNFAREKGLKLHVDGARIFNAAQALSVSVAELVAPADSVAFCLSKGLCAPAGSLVCGTEDFIRRARRCRKVVGGGMRQVGILAACGVVALNEMVERLHEDHENAHKLALGISDIKGFELDPSSVKTNIVFFDISKDGADAGLLVEMLEKEGVRVLALGSKSLRAVTHYKIGPKDIETTLKAISRAVLKL